MTNDPALLLGRILASAIFIMAGYSKLMGAAATQGYFTKIGVPLPEVAYWVSLVIELGGGLLFLVGFQSRPVALVLSVFCIATALLGHQFWADPTQATQFMKNLAMTGGFLAFFAAGPGRFSLDAMMNREPSFIRTST